MNHNPNVIEILHHIIDSNGRPVNDRESDYVYIILGRPGPTGKTWLCEALRHSGIKAFEISESVYSLVRYDDLCNHYVVDHASKTVTIILNKRL